MIDFDSSKSLQELEAEAWPEPEFQSGVVTNAHRLHRLALREFTVEDLRFMIVQQHGLQYLIPIALEHLRRDPLIEGDLYPGDLLAAVLRADSRVWIADPALRTAVGNLAQHALSLVPNLDELDRRTTQNSLIDAHTIFERAEYFAQHGRA